MFKKWGEDSEVKAETTEEISENISERSTAQEKNTILKGSKLIGDINVTCDLELTGDIEGNITSDLKSNILIKGSCKGNIFTREGNVAIEGELNNGDIIAGNNVNISGRFNGGEVKAEGKIYINGEFQGRLEANEIEIGPEASGNGELLYRECISIAKGAKIDGQISRVQEELKLVKTSPESKAADIDPPGKNLSEAK